MSFRVHDCRVLGTNVVKPRTSTHTISQRSNGAARHRGDASLQPRLASQPRLAPNAPSRCTKMHQGQPPGFARQLSWLSFRGICPCRSKVISRCTLSRMPLQHPSIHREATQLVSTARRNRLQNRDTNSHVLVQLLRRWDRPTAAPPTATPAAAAVEATVAPLKRCIRAAAAAASIAAAHTSHCNPATREQAVSKGIIKSKLSNEMRHVK